LTSVRIKQPGGRVGAESRNNAVQQRLYIGQIVSGRFKNNTLGRGHPWFSAGPYIGDFRTQLHEAIPLNSIG
jgi:hypothetical protein